MSRAGWVILALLAASPARGVSQQWRLRFDATAQRVSFRGVTPDSIAEALVIDGPTGGPVTPDGYAVTCFGDGYCRYYRAGPLRRGLPASGTADLTMWGLGVTGLRVRLQLRTLTDLTGDRLWPGTAPAFRLVEGYAEYVRDGLTARLGRILEGGRLGGAGAGALDGLRGSWRFDRPGFEVGGYLGWGLARGTVLSVTSPAVNPLAEFQPGHRQVVAGAFAGIHRGVVDGEVEYRREVDPRTDYFVSERAAVAVAARTGRFRIQGGFDYNLAERRWGTADATLSLGGSSVWGSATVHRYQPFFDLWTVWGVFSPVAYHGVRSTLGARPLPWLTLGARGEWFRYEDTETSTPTVQVEDRGWRWGADASIRRLRDWTLELSAHGEFLPGAASRGLEARIGWTASKALELSARGGSLERPLELRFQDAAVHWLGIAGDLRFGERWQLALAVDRYWESRDRPDAAAFDWNQWRASARVALTLRSGADRWTLPPARPEGSAP